MKPMAANGTNEAQNCEIVSQIFGVLVYMCLIQAFLLFIKKS